MRLEHRARFIEVRLDGALHGLRQAARLLALAGLLLHAIVPILHHRAIGLGGYALGNAAVIFDPAGPRVAPLADLPSSAHGGHGPANAKFIYCPLCLAADLSHIFVQPAAPVLLQPSEAVADLFPASRDNPPVSPPWFRPRSRAPPAIA
jgi:hypothetical protein